MRVSVVPSMSQFSSFDEGQHSVTISDAQLPEMPLVYVNAGFERFSGYSRYEVLGRNCRFLQNANRDQPGIPIMRAAIAEKKSCLVDLVNYRKDGRVLHNRMLLQPVFDDAKRLVYYVGLQSDVSPLMQLQERLTAFFSTRGLLVGGSA